MTRPTNAELRELLDLAGRSNQALEVRAGNVDKDKLFIHWPPSNCAPPERVLASLNHHFDHEADAAYLAHAWNVAPRLAEEVLRLREELADIRAREVLGKPQDKEEGR